MNKKLIIQDLEDIAYELKKEASIGFNQSFEHIDVMHLVNLSQKIEQIVDLLGEE